MGHFSLQFEPFSAKNAAKTPKMGAKIGDYSSLIG
jgi:hypothetical protein